MLFAGGPAAATLMREPDERITARFLTDLHDALPADARGDRRRQGPSLGVGQRLRAPGPHRLQAPLEGALGGHGNLHLAGDYFAELGNMEAAARTGAVAAERVEALLRDQPTSDPRSTMPDFHGVLPALITPFTEDGADIDADALAAIVNRLIGAGVCGLVPGGSTGEFTTLTTPNAASSPRCRGSRRRPRAGRRRDGGAFHARDVELSVHAERAGASAVMVVPPFYDALGWRELLAHYAAVAEAIRSRSCTTTSRAPRG